MAHATGASKVRGMRGTHVHRARFTRAASILPAAIAGVTLFFGAASNASAQDQPAAEQSGAIGAEASFAEVETRGEGDVHVILVPGLSSDWRAWEIFLEDLDNLEDYTMHAVTLPGFGGSEPWPAPEEQRSTQWLEMAVRATASYIEDLPVEQAVVMGHGTLGGFIALRSAIEHPDLVSEAVVIDALAPAMPFAGRMPPHEARQQMVDQLEPTLAGITDEEWSQYQDVENATYNRDARDTLRKMFEASSTGAAVEYLIQMMRTDLSDDLDRLEVPTLFIFAWRNDMAKEEEIAKHLTMQGVAGLPTADYVTVGRTRRFVMMDRPDGLHMLFRTYLRDHETEAALP